MKNKKEDIEKIKEDIKDNPVVMFIVNIDGSITMITTGDISEVQEDIATKVLVCSGKHSLVLKLVLWLEILFEKSTYFISDLFSRKKY